MINRIVVPELIEYVYADLLGKDETADQEVMPRKECSPVLPNRVFMQL